jgi:glycosyltransferase involved in cell wall biosynthesis
MKVLHVIPSVSERSGGPATAIVPLCRALQAEGIEVLLATTNHELTQAQVDCIADYKGVTARFFPVQVGASFKYSRPLAVWLKANVEQFDVVHIHAVFNHASLVAAAVCRRVRVPYVVRPLGTLDPWSMKQKPLRKRMFWTLAGKRMLESSAAVHYTARAEKHATEESLGLNHGRVIPLGVEINGSKSPVVAEYPYVLALSRLHPKKGLDLLIDAFRSRQEDEWRLVIAGDGPADYVGSLKQRAAGSEKIVFTGWVEGEQKEKLLRGASVLALTSRQENFGFSALEAMARAVPVLLSAEVNLAADVSDAGAGWIVKLDRLEQGLGVVMEDGAERKRRGEAAYRFAQRYSWQRTAAELADLYREILNNGSATIQRV